MKLNFTRKTWYFFLLVAAAVSLLTGLAALAGQNYGFFEQVTFCITAISALFLAAEKGSPAADKRDYFLVFIVLMISYMVSGFVGYLASALAWPGLLIIEYRHGKPIARQMQLVAGAEVMHLVLVLGVAGGATTLTFCVNLLWVLLACARGWAALTLYKLQQE